MKEKNILKKGYFWIIFSLLFIESIISYGFNFENIIASSMSSFILTFLVLGIYFLFYKLFTKIKKPKLTDNKKDGKHKKRNTSST